MVKQHEVTDGNTGETSRRWWDSSPRASRGQVEAWKDNVKIDNPLSYPAPYEEEHSTCQLRHWYEQPSVEHRR